MLGEAMQLWYARTTMLAACARTHYIELSLLCSPAMKLRPSPAKHVATFAALSLALANGATGRCAAVLRGTQLTDCLHTAHWGRQ